MLFLDKVFGIDPSRPEISGSGGRKAMARARISWALFGGGQPAGLAWVSVALCLSCCGARVPSENSQPMPTLMSESYRAVRRLVGAQQPEVFPPPADPCNFIDAQYDELCDDQRVSVPALLPPTSKAGPHFEAEVPRRLHQIWFGPEHPEFGPRMRSWQRYAGQFGYAYRRWGVEDDALIAKMMPTKNYQIYHYYLSITDWRAASDVLRLSLLATFGGIYLDSDLQPPKSKEGVFDLDTWLPMQNITLIAEHFARETASQATFLTNCMIAASPQHPLVEHWVSALPENHLHWMKVNISKAEYTTGPFFITRQLAGPVHVLGMQEGYRYQLFGDNDMLDALPEND